MLTPKGQDIFDAAQKISDNICYLLPKNMDDEELIQLTSNRCEIENNVMNKRPKTKTVYFGKLIEL